MLYELLYFLDGVPFSCKGKNALFIGTSDLGTLIRGAKALFIERRLDPTWHPALPDEGGFGDPDGVSLRGRNLIGGGFHRVRG